MASQFNPYRDLIAIVFKDLVRVRPELANSVQSLNDLWQQESESYVAAVAFGRTIEFPSRPFYDRLGIIFRLFNQTPKTPKNGGTQYDYISVEKWFPNEVKYFVADAMVESNEHNIDFEPFCAGERLPIPKKSSPLWTGLKKRTDSFVRCSLASATLDQSRVGNHMTGILLVHVLYAQQGHNSDIEDVNEVIINALRYAFVRASQVKRYLMSINSTNNHAPFDIVDISPVQQRDNTSRPFTSLDLNINILKQAVSDTDPLALLKSIITRPYMTSIQSITEIILERVISAAHEPLPRVAQVKIDSCQCKHAFSREPSPALPSTIYSRVMPRLGRTSTHVHLLGLVHICDDALSEMFVTGRSCKQQLFVTMQVFAGWEPSRKGIIERLVAGDLLQLIKLTFDRIRATTLLVGVHDDDPDKGDWWGEVERECKRAAALCSLARMNMVSDLCLKRSIDAYKKSMFMVLRYASLSEQETSIINAYMALIQLNLP